ncbi:MAG: GDSL-type esterase/lipase family protein [Desulfovibrio sp.]|jgi:lysophospholipase L1-like esterase|nr:GDSL-type esterase/lipase family protein [Desulfovibrio sp.]
MTRRSLLFLGDSLTFGFDWASALPDFIVYNFGINGDTTDGVLARLNDAAAVKPDKIFLQIGINDLLSEFAWLGNHESQSKANLYAILRNHTQIWEYLAENLPDAILYVCSLLPATRSFDPQGTLNNDVRALCTMLEKMSASRGLTYINLYNALRDEGGALREDCSEDGVHLLWPGYQIWLETLMPFISNEC